MKNTLTTIWFISFIVCASFTAPAQQPELLVQTGHSGAVYSVAFSPDGRVLASAGAGATIKLWEVATGRELRALNGHSGRVWSVAFSPDGRTLASGGDDKTVKLWDAATGRELRAFVGHSGSASAVAFSPSGKVLASGSSSLSEKDRDGSIKLWDMATGRELRSFKGHSEVVPTALSEPPRLVTSGIDSPILKTRLQNVTSLAFSPDGKALVSGGTDGTIKLWEIENGRGREVLTGHTESVLSVAFSPDGKTIASGSADRTIRLWDTGTGQKLRVLTGHTDGVLSVAFSPDGKVVASGGSDRTVRLWEAATGQALLSMIGHLGIVRSVAYSPDGGIVASCGMDAEIKLLDVATGRVLRILKSDHKAATSIAISLDGKAIANGNADRTVTIWEAASGRGPRALAGHSGAVSSVALSHDRKVMASGSADGTAKLWEVETGRELRALTGHSAAISSIAFSPGGPAGSLVASGSQDKTIKLWDVATGQELRTLTGHSSQVSSVAFSPSGQTLAGGGGDGSIRLWDVKTGRKLLTLTGHSKYKAIGEVMLESTGKSPILTMLPMHSVAFSPDGKMLASGSADKTARLWEVATCRKLRTLTGHSSRITSVVFNPDGNVLATGSAGTLSLWEVATGRKLYSLAGHTGPVIATTFLLDGKIVASGNTDNLIKLWDAATGRQIASLIAFNRGDWVVVTPDGRFDTNNLDEIRMLHWTIPDVPFRALPPEIFTRDYYEPRLLSRLLAGEQLPLIPDLSQRNRAQPVVRIAEVKPQVNSNNEPADTVTVTVEVLNSTDTFTRDGRQVSLESGTHDLRLFRDGQLVGYAPEQDGPIELESGKATVTFKNIKLPRRVDFNRVEFSAYAFNVDRVKSETARKTHVLPRPLPTVKGRAYVVSVGINAYENPSLDLKFAANDARRLQSVLMEKLKAAGEYEEVVPITLLSDYEVKDGQRTITARQATKGNIARVLDLLAGRRVDPEQMASIPNADKLRPARPEDLVLLSFAGHGYADEAGLFYLVTYDTGAGVTREVSSELLRKSISSDELSLWLRDVDAGELVMIVDACQSAAAVEGEGFKPGPMGSRGLGQLAYDKGMRILAATQADNAALEHRLIKQGLLTYALVHDGIELGRADFKPEDNKITIGEWLEYARERVPELFGEVKRGQVRSQHADVEGAARVIILPGAGSQMEPGRLLIQGKSVGTSAKPSIAEEQIQRPALFDFSRKRRDVLLQRK